MCNSKYDDSDKKYGDNTNVQKLAVILLTMAHNLYRTISHQEKKETAPYAEKTKLKVNKIVIHKVDGFYTFLEIGWYMNRNGILGVSNTKS